MTVDLILRGGTVVNHDGRLAASVAVKDGKIVAIGGLEVMPEAREIVDVSGKFLLPGAIDTHVHLGAYQPFEDDLQDTAAAAVGGLTVVANFIGTGLDLNEGSYAPRLRRYIELWDSHTMCDGIFHVIITEPLHLDEIPQYIDEFGITSFKFFSYRGADAEKLGLRDITDGTLFDGFRRIAALGPRAVAMCHCENTDIIDVLRNELRTAGRQDLAALTEARPGWVEAMDVAKVRFIQQETGATSFIVHVSSGLSVELIAEAKSRGLSMFAETTPSYLTHTGADDGLGPIGVEFPPLKLDSDRERLWRGLADGTIDTIGTDYASICRQEKLSVWDAKPGFAHMQLMLPVLLSYGVNGGRISLERAVETCSTRAAQIFGLFPKKGVLAAGSDADIVVVDLDLTRKITPELLRYYYSDHTLYDGMELTGWPVATYLRGELVARDGEVVGSPGMGRYLRRSLELGANSVVAPAERAAVS